MLLTGRDSGSVLWPALLLFCLWETQPVDSQQVPCAGGEQCDVTYSASLEDVNRRLEEALSNLKSILDKQSRLLNMWKNCSSGNETYQPGYVAEYRGSLNPCSEVSDTVSNIAGVAQLGDRMYFSCNGLKYLPVYNAQTLYPISELALPGPDYPYPDVRVRHLFSSRTENSVYVVLSYSDSVTGQIPGSYVWKVKSGEQEWKLVISPTLQNFTQMGPAIDGTVMFSNSSSIVFYDSFGSVRRTLDYDIPSSFQRGYIYELLQTSSGSIYFGGLRSFAEVSSDGTFVRSFGEGQVQPAGNSISYMSDISEGPKDRILIAENGGNRVIMLDTVENQLFELIGDRSFDIKAPQRISYDPGNYRLIVAEYYARTDGDGNSVRVFNVAKSSA